ncbi:hypothetical protein BH10ACI2_BH10ACI2_25780 [soil metagenome]
MRALVGSFVFLVMGTGFYLLAANETLTKRKIWLVPSSIVQKKAIKVTATLLFVLSAMCLLVFLLWMAVIVQ